jgi:hypothetical protein
MFEDVERIKHNQYIPMQFILVVEMAKFFKS